MLRKLHLCACVWFRNEHWRYELSHTNLSPMHAHTHTLTHTHTQNKPNACTYINAVSSATVHSRIDHGPIISDEAASGNSVIEFKLTVAALCDPHRPSLDLFSKWRRRNKLAVCKLDCHMAHFLLLSLSLSLFPSDLKSPLFSNCMFNRF